jgi:stage V sporulation protein G
LFDKKRPCLYSVEAFVLSLVRREIGLKKGYLKRIADMKITEVKVFPAKEMGSRLKAYATVVFDNCFIIRDLKVIEGDKGLFVSMPSRRRKDGTFRDIVHPLNAEMRQIIESAIVAEYNKVMAQGGVIEHSEGD